MSSTNSNTDRVENQAETGAEGAPDRAMAERHLTLLDEGAERFTFSTFTDVAKGQAKPNPDRLALIIHGSLDECWPRLVQLAAAGAAVFVVINETDLTGRKNENIIHIRALWQEADRGDEPALPIEPHITIESSPGKHHRYILTEGGPLDEFEAVQMRLVDDYGSDPNAKDRSRVLRLAGFYHRKDRNAPHMVRIVGESGERPLPWEQVRQIFPPVERSAHRGNVVDLPALGTPLAKIAEIASALAVLKSDMGYMDWLVVGIALHWTGAGREAFDLWNDWSKTSANYREGECLYRWGTFDRREGGVTLRTLFGMANKAGWDSKINTDSNGVEERVNMQRQRQLEAFGNQHAIAMIQGVAVVVWRELDQNVDRMTTRLAKVGDLALKHEPDMLPFFVLRGGDQKPGIVYKPLVATWRASPARRTYDQVIFKPKAGMIAGTTALPDGKILNLYQGLAVTPKAGDVDLILDHIKSVWCSGSEVGYRYVIGWLARMFQHPGERGHTVIVLKSGEGTGKNIIVDMLVKAFGEHAMVATKGDDLTGRFNDQLATSVLVFANEAVWGGDKSREGALKSLITDIDLPAERKYLPKYRVNNCVHIIMASNSDWAAPIGMDDRRFVLLDVDESRKGDTKYFGRLAEQIDNGGTEAIVHYLLEYDVSDFNPRTLPDMGLNQVSKGEAKLKGADSVTQWWADCLYSGDIMITRDYGDRRSRENIAHEWDAGTIALAVDDPYAAYKEWAQSMRARIESNIAFGRKLTKYSQRKESRREGVRRWDIPSLARCRKAFEVASKQRWNWPAFDELPAEVPPAEVPPDYEVPF